MKAYLAGPMTGIKHHNFPLFDHVTEQLRAAGYETYNPADLTRNFWGSLEAFEAMPPDEQLYSVKTLLAKELTWVCLNAEVVYFLPGWENSYGARAEHAAASACKIEIRMVPEEMLP
jgi:hypothetical protein